MKIRVKSTLGYLVPGDTMLFNLNEERSEMFDVTEDFITFT